MTRRPSPLPFLAVAVAGVAVSVAGVAVSLDGPAPRTPTAAVLPEVVIVTREVRVTVTPSPRPRATPTPTPEPYVSPTPAPHAWMRGDRQTQARSELG